MRAIILGLLILLAACETTPASGLLAATAPEEKRDFESARASWAAAGIQNYDFTFYGICGECLDGYDFPARVKVRGGVVESARSIETQEVLGQTDLKVQTVDELLERISSTLPLTDLRVQADYDDSGYPTSYQSECREPGIMDCGYEFTVSEFEVISD